MNPIVMLRDGFKRSAKLTGMERQGLVAYHHELKTLEGKISELQAHFKKATEQYLKDFGEIAEKHSLDPNMPVTQYEMDKKNLRVIAQAIPKDHLEHTPKETEQDA